MGAGTGRETAEELTNSGHVGQGMVARLRRHGSVSPVLIGKASPAMPGHCKATLIREIVDA